jgi:hypothetical protein
MDDRYFTVIKSSTNFNGGRYKSETPIKAAKKIAIKIIGKTKNNITFTIREITKNNKKKTYDYKAGIINNKLVVKSNKKTSLKIKKQKGGKEPENFILITDIGRNIGSILAFIALLKKHKKNIIKLSAIVINGFNIENRKILAIYLLNKYDINDIPLFILKNEDTDKKEDKNIDYNACILPTNFDKNYNSSDIIYNITDINNLKINDNDNVLCMSSLNFVNKITDVSKFFYNIPIIFININTIYNYSQQIKLLSYNIYDEDSKNIIYIDDDICNINSIFTDNDINNIDGLNFSNLNIKYKNFNDLLFIYMVLNNITDIEDCTYIKKTLLEFLDYESIIQNQQPSNTQVSTQSSNTQVSNTQNPMYFSKETYGRNNLELKNRRKKAIVVANDAKKREKARAEARKTNTNKNNVSKEYEDDFEQDEDDKEYEDDFEQDENGEEYVDDFEQDEESIANTGGKYKKYIDYNKKYKKTKKIQKDTKTIDKSKKTKKIEKDTKTTDKPKKTKSTNKPKKLKLKK